MKYCPACKTEYPASERFCPIEGRLLSLRDPYQLVGRTLLDKYRIDALVGMGGMGAVYSAHHLKINRHVAFKILQPNLALGNERLLELFQREAEIAGRLNHENIVDIKDAGRTPDHIAYIVMEWLEGSTLEEEIEKKGPISVERAAAIFRQVAVALDYAHAQGVIHRDLKPSNIMIVRGPDGHERIKVVDFGIAKVVSETATSSSSPVSLLMGTPHYASPEQFAPGSRIDSRSDIYSLGVVLYRMLSGSLPFTARTLQELIRLQLTSLPPSIRRHRPDVPELIERLLFRMLDRDAGKRPPRALDAFNIFTQFLKKEEGKTASLDLVTPGISSLATSQIVSRPSTSGSDGEDKSPPDEGHPAATDQYLRVKTVAEPAVVTLPQTLRIAEPQDGGSKVLAVDRDPKKYAIAAAAALVIFAGLLTLYFEKTGWPFRGRIGVPGPPLISSPVPDHHVELMSYYLDITSDKCRTLSRGTGDESLTSNQSFRFHFLPQRSGYLYILAQNDKNVLTTFLSASPDPETGVKTNFVEAGSDYNFPSGDGLCIGITDDERMMAFTIIFSPIVLPQPGFFAAPGMHELTATEQHQFNHWRSQQKTAAAQIKPDTKYQLTRVTIAPASVAPDQPVIFDLPIKRR